MFSIAFGAVVRHTARAITGIIAIVLVLAPLSQLLPGTVGEHIQAYLPTVADQFVITAQQGADDLPGPSQGLGVFVLWTTVLMLMRMLIASASQASRCMSWWPARSMRSMRSMPAVEGSSV